MYLVSKKLDNLHLYKNKAVLLFKIMERVLFTKSKTNVTFVQIVTTLYKTGTQCKSQLYTKQESILNHDIMKCGGWEQVFY